MTVDEEEFVDDSDTDDTDGDTDTSTDDDNDVAPPPRMASRKRIREEDDTQCNEI